MMREKLKVLDLFSGIGGFSLGLERTGGFETVAFCEIEEFPRKVLAKHWPEVPCFEDVKKLKGKDIGPVDVICGGYPCQPFSVAGERRGEEDDRHLWPEFSRLVAELRPTWVIGENVAGHVSMGLDDVLSDLEGQGYTARTFIIPASAVDAPHRRDRVWIVAHAASEGLPIRRQARRKTGNTEEETGVVSGSERCGETLADTNDAGLQGRSKAGNAGSKREGRDKLAERCCDGKGSTWTTEPRVGRVANGVPRRVDRLKALGNAVVPQIPEMIGHAILDATE